MRCTNF